jgi:hypothetical protein
MMVILLSDNRIEDQGALTFLDAVPAHFNLVLHGNPISEGVWRRLEERLGERFAFEYADDLLSIPHGHRNRPSVNARNDFERVSNTLAPSVPAGDHRPSE